MTLPVPALLHPGEFASKKCDRCDTMVLTCVPKALCRPCYAQFQLDLSHRSQKEIVVDRVMWDQRMKYPVEDAEADRQFLGSVKNRPYYEDRLIAWKARVSKGTGKSRPAI